jgi:hypothetical protein
MNIFEVATRQKLRFETGKGLLSTEDLWDLPLTSATGKVCLDEIAIALHKQVRATSDVVSFVDNTATQNPTILLRFEVVKHVIEQRKLENAEAANAKARAETKQQILAALAKKRENAVDAMTEEQLLKKLAEL